MGLDLAAGDWRTLAASIAGPAHAEAGQPCADACAVRVAGPPGRELLVAVAADGAGSWERAAEGARLACEAILALAAERAAREGLAGFDRDLAAGWLEAVRTCLGEAAAATGTERRAFSCTLLVALVDARRAVFLQIGDGAIVYRGRDGAYLPALWPQTGDYANTTFFVTDDDAATRLQTTTAEDVDELALLTDGLQSLALSFATRQAHAPFFAPMFERLRQEPPGESVGLVPELRSFLGSPDVNRRTDDDKTLVLATRLVAQAPTTGGPGG
ncbi:MAG TPA: PP2C family serine/threonine-protein phosphatase [Vicinamibacteria bacterium]|nr:PP2C family serine/threonine-protein phosphatase [Vicinamibacteria bacterium]